MANRPKISFLVDALMSLVAAAMGGKGLGAVINRPKFNFVIDALMFLVTAAMGGIGFLLRYDLISGEERWAKYGSNVRLTFWGLERHDWGTIHLILAFVLVGLLVLHIVFHWNMIPGLYRRLIGHRKARWLVLTIFIIASIFLLLFPFMVNPVVGESRGGQGQGRGLGIELPRKTVQIAESPTSHPDEVEMPTQSPTVVRGYMMLSEVAEQYDVPMEYLKEQLGIPESESSNQRIGWLINSYGFTMSKVRAVINDYLEFH